MSQMGQEPQRGQVGMSALPPKADSAKHHWDVRFGASPQLHSAISEVAACLSRPPQGRRFSVFLFSAINHRCSTGFAGTNGTDRCGEIIISVLNHRT